MSRTGVHDTALYVRRQECLPSEKRYKLRGFVLTEVLGNICAATTLGFEGQMSADAAGITACLFALSHLSFQIQHENIENHYHQLRDCALEHAEAGVILAAID
jgi:hypothetical protein